MGKYHQRPDGRYETTRTDPRTKKRIHFYGMNARDIDRQIMEYQAQAQKGRTFQAVADEWETIHFPTLAHNTIKSYRPALRRASDKFGALPISSIRPLDVQRFIQEFAAGGQARKTVTTQLLVTRLLCAYAVQAGDIDVSPCDHVTVPKNLPKSHRQAASLHDESIIKANVDKWLLPFFVLYTGLRRGEALALTWDDIDLGNEEITVSKSLYCQHGKMIPKAPKTTAGTRIVPILAPLMPHLQAITPKQGYLFRPLSGKDCPIREWEFDTMWKSYVKETGIQSTAHQLRHSYATMLFECGLEIKDAQDLLGHSTAAMTQDVYTHLRATRKKKIANQLNQSLSL